MRHSHFRLLLAATLCVSGGTAEAWTGPAPEADHDAAVENAPADNVPAETAASLDELLDALGLDALAVDIFLKIDGIDGESAARVRAGKPEFVEGYGDDGVRAATRPWRSGDRPRWRQPYLHAAGRRPAVSRPITPGSRSRSEPAR